MTTPRPLRVAEVMECTIGGTRRHIGELSQGLVERGVEVVLFASAVRDPTFREDLDRLRRAGVEAVEIPLRREIAPLADASHLVRLCRRFAGGRFDAVHTHSSKAGVLGLTKTMALELGKFGITVNAILPGPIYTGMTRQNFDQEYIRTHWERKTAVRRLGAPEDIANGVLFLALEESSFLTGHGLVIDGGQTLRM